MDNNTIDQQAMYVNKERKTNQNFGFGLDFLVPLQSQPKEYLNDSNSDDKDYEKSVINIDQAID